MGRGRDREGDEEKDVEVEELRRVMKNLKDGKAMEEDGISNEVWKYGGEEVERWLGEICDRVWRGKRWPDEWGEGVVVSVVKKGQEEKVEDYRGIILT